MMAGMITLILIGLLRGIRTHPPLFLENLALRHQLVVLQRTVPRPRLRTADRLFWVLLSHLWSGWTDAVSVVQPATVIRWQRTGFKLFWTWKSRRNGPGRPAVAPEIRALIRRMSKGRAADSRGTPETGGRDLAGGGLQVRGPPSEAAIADLADLSRQPPGKPRLRGLLRRAHRAVQGLVRLRGPGARAAARPSHQRH